MQPVIKILPDLLNVKSLLTIGDSHHLMRPEAAAHASVPHWALGVNAFKCQTGAGGWRSASSTLSEATLHASAFHWTLTLVRSLRPTVLINEPLIMVIMACL